MAARAAVILAAGQGTRMKSLLPKVLHPLAGRAMVDHAINAAEAAGCERVVVVVGTHAPEVVAHVTKRLGEQSIAVQDPPLGTGHAVLAAKAQLADFDGEVVVTFADCPLLRGESIQPLFGRGAALTVLGFEAADPGAYGRLILGEDGSLERITEAKGAPDEVLAIKTCNSGVLVCDRGLLFSLLGEVGNDNPKGEYYLTDVVQLARGRDLRCEAVFTDEAAVQGVNSQAELAAAERVWQQGRRRELMDQGVRMPAPETVWLAWDTVVEAGAAIEPNVVFGAGVTVRSGAVIGAFSHLEGCEVRSGAKVGPYARLRPGADIGEGARVGNFVEVKNVAMGPGAKANHLAYLGDGQVGAGANIGAGTIFCNYDGFNKARTEVGEGAFVGSNSSLVAPVKIGEGAMVGSGSVVTEDVAAGDLYLERAAPTVKAGWAARFREAMKARRGK
ncbi:bifunctional UDP-N-acetylglucosamine diphosphorylase/glucosamine-1-phosphate N-acetyltransferase GlmU [Brevundimonas sp. 2R-24]|uniref:Bifunctional protein GlmU n=1 Tax=Peiella sedimenti TaxID=3061083 RepID=A0ABT8SMI6_9CAUL|nr:bifunctional UDP-N-acetylglucosamine diphosphorylase/glucosamine-1-phosphate N-acetyltransferase GlmU [Caulobacteraceae bacterium XZ-24]